MPKKVKILICFLTLFLFAGFLVNSAQAENSTDFTCAVYFTGVGCSHCANTDPVVLEELPREYPNFIVIEYEIYQQKENAPLLYEYNEKYNSGLGIPLVIFNKKGQIKGDRPILENIKGKIENLNNNKCPLADGTSIDFNELDIASLPGQPKIWTSQGSFSKGEIIPQPFYFFGCS